jgi:G:T-mismatch repair DNA endonuclease (very short patch repair protein)
MNSWLFLDRFTLALLPDTSAKFLRKRLASANRKPIPFFFPDLTAKDIWEKDERKFTHIKNLGFAFACVWESQLKIENFLDLFYKHIKEYISNKLQVVNNVKRS